MIKTLGQVFTPDYIVELILDDIGYTHGNILNKKIMEPSFGKGVFLVHILERLIAECQYCGLNLFDIQKQISNNIYGIEIDTSLYNETIGTLNEIVRKNNIPFYIKWNLFNQNALEWKSFNEFDYVVGNPPYVRVHNLDNKTKELMKNFSFSKGMKELYITFFELGLKMLNNQGKLSYITPNSYITNTSQKEFRKYLLENNLVSKIENFGSWKVFDKVGSYTCITVLEKNKQHSNFLYTSIRGSEREYGNIYNINDFDFKELPWDLTSEDNEKFLKDNNKKQNKVGDFVDCQYGFATNCDRVYISKDIKPIDDNKVIFNGYEIEAGLIKKIVKGSTYYGQGNYYILFPYHDDVSVIKEDEMKNQYPLAYKYLLDHRDELEKRDMEKSAIWYQFARSQGLKNCFKKKLVINNIISGYSSQVGIYELPANVFVYSGIYITSNQDNLDFIKEQLETEEFARYVKLKGKDMSGGYKNFNSKIVKEYGIEKPA